MYILDTVNVTMDFSATGKIKIGNSVMYTIAALARTGRKIFTADDIAYIINRSVKASWNKVTIEQVEKAIKVEVKHNAANEVRRGFQKISKLEHGFFQYGK